MQDAPGQHAPAAEAIGEIAAEQPEDAAGKRRDVEQPPDPHLELRRARRGAGQLEQRRPDDQRQHQHLVDVEREADRRRSCRSATASASAGVGLAVGMGMLRVPVIEFTAWHWIRGSRVIEFTSRWCPFDFQPRTRVIFGPGRCRRGSASVGAGARVPRGRCSSPMPGVVDAGYVVAAVRRARGRRRSTAVPFHDFGENPDSRDGRSGPGVCRAARRSTRCRPRRRQLARLRQGHQLPAHQRRRDGRLSRLRQGARRRCCR